MSVCCRIGLKREAKATQKRRVKIMTNYTKRAQDMNIEAVAIKGVRWFQKSAGNTYHISYISALINGKWVELGNTGIRYGYGDHYIVTACNWLMEADLIDGMNEYDLSKWSIREELKIEVNVEDVKRKKDM